jgi:hypothetical protein
MAQVTTSHTVKFDSVFDRPLDSAYNEGGIDQYRMCEWGIMKRAVEANCEGRTRTQDRRARRLDVEVRHRHLARFEYLRAGDAQEQRDRGDAEQRFALHHAEDDGRISRAGIREDDERGNDDQAPGGIEAGKGRRRQPDGAWISVAQKQGLRILVESHSTRSEAASDELDGPTLAAMFRAQARAVDVLEKDPTPFIHYFVAETGGLLDAKDFQTWRLLHAPPQPYTRERFDDEYNWTVKWNMTVPGATYENTVDKPGVGIVGRRRAARVIASRAAPRLARTAKSTCRIRQASAQDSPERS